MSRSKTVKKQNVVKEEYKSPIVCNMYMKSFEQKALATADLAPELVEEVCG